MKQKILLSIQNISKSFGGLQAVQNLSFDIPKNKIIGLIGPNGAGKTTAFNLITHFIPKDTGKIFYKKEDLKKLATHKLVKRGIARTFQQIRLFSELTVEENLLLACSHQYDSWWKSFLPQDEVRQKREIKKMLALVDLESYAYTLAKNLSYGQSKLIEILRCILIGADLILLDEPASGINPTRLKTIESLILKMKKSGRTFLIIEHNMPFLMKISDEIIVMEDGKFLMQDTPAKVQKNKKVLDAYLGG